MKELLIRAGIVWVLFIPVAILNGIIREKVYEPYIGDLLAHQISTVIACIAFIILADFLLRNKFVISNAKQLMIIGIFWVVLTILFEFGFGHYIAGNSWSRLFADYNIFAGRIWGVFLLAIFLTPFIIHKH